MSDAPLNRPLVLGTRASALAVAQVELTQAALVRAFPALAVTVEKFTTRGDRKLDLSLLRSNEAGGKGLFTRELEEALLGDTIDLAVHSLKDLPGHLPDGLEIVAVLERASTADLLISKHAGGLDGLPQGATIGTSSIRRARQIQWRRPDLAVCEWRGNVQTRLRKLAEPGAPAAIVLAEAGLARLGFETTAETLQFEEHAFYLSSLAPYLLPAIGQGAIALEARIGDVPIGEIAREIDHQSTHIAVRAERELQRVLAGDCTLPVGVRTELRDGEISMKGILFTDATDPRTAEATGSANDPEAVGRLLAERLGI